MKMSFVFTLGLFRGQFANADVSTAQLDALSFSAIAKAVVSDCEILR